MLPAHLLSLVEHDGITSPRYLTARDEVWMRAVLDVFECLVGRTVAERDEHFGRLVRKVARQHGVSEKIADGVATVLIRRCRTRVAAEREPRVVRNLAFACAARNPSPDRHAALVAAAAELATTPEAVAASLFADRGSARVIEATAPLSAAEAVEAYNLALVQGLLLRSEKVVAHVREHVRAVVRFAKLSGLLCTYTLDELGTRLEVSGPLAVLRHTTKYGHALASFFPAVLSTPGFRLHARCVVGGEVVHVRIDASDRVARTHALPRDADSNVERSLARDVRRLGGGWTLTRETTAITFDRLEGRECRRATCTPAGRRVFFPDFTLTRDGVSVLVEVVGFYTPEYLRGKLEALRAAPAERLIVCVDESLACEDGEVPGTVIRYRKKIDAALLLKRADELASGAAGRDVDEHAQRRAGHDQVVDVAALARADESHRHPRSGDAHPVDRERVERLG